MNKITTIDDPKRILKESNSTMFQIFMTTPKLTFFWAEDNFQNIDAGRVVQGMVIKRDDLIDEHKAALHEAEHVFTHSKKGDLRILPLPVFK